MYLLNERERERELVRKSSNIQPFDQQYDYIAVN